VVPIDALHWPFWLEGAFGSPTPAGGTDTSVSGLWSLPSYSIQIGMPEVPRFAMYTGCMVDRLSWTMQRGGLLTATVGLIAQGETVATTTAAGTPPSLRVDRFGHFAGSITRAGQPLGNVVSAEVTYANNLDRIETIRSDGKIDGADPSMAMLSGRMTVRFADNVLLDQAIAGSASELEFVYAPVNTVITDIGGDTPSTVTWKLTAHAVYLPRPRIALEGPQGVQATFDWQAALPAAGGPMCTVTRTVAAI
jgi:hypothetical protein